MRILYVTLGLPYPPNSGARIRDHHLIRRMAGQHRVSVLSLLEDAGELAHLDALRTFCVHVDAVVADRGWPGDAWRVVVSAWQGRPLATAVYDYPELARRIHRLAEREAFDIVQFEHSFLAMYRAALPPGFAGRTVLSLHNVGQDQYASMVTASRGRERWVARLKAWLMRGWEVDAARSFDHVITVSEQERERLATLGLREHVSVVGNGVDTASLHPLPEPDEADDTLLFIGIQGYLPNRDAVRHFCRDVLPLIRARRPACRLRVVGPGGPEHLADLAQTGVVEILGPVADPMPEYEQSRVAVVPLRSGGGTRLKILEAMALGRPVVSTPVGCEGLELAAGRDLAVAEAPEAFANAVVRLLADQDHWRGMAAAARRRVETGHDWDRFARELAAVYQALVQAPAMSPSLSDGARPGLSVIIPVRDMRDELTLCLEALDHSALADVELIVVDDGSMDDSAAVAAGRCDRLLRNETSQGAAAARNRGARQARAPLLFFLDADVLVQPDTLQRIATLFRDDASLDAAFCAYRAHTLPDNFVSRYKNLLHHYTHRVSNPEAATFCGGFGAMRRGVFEAFGGFDADRRAMEDVDLGYRLYRSGRRIRLCADIQLTHAKRYTLSGLVRSDLFHRAIPWTRLMLAHRVVRADLNTRPHHVLSVAGVFVMGVVPFWPGLGLAAATGIEALLATALVVLNRGFLGYARRHCGLGFALAVLPMLGLQYAYSGLGLVLGGLSFLGERLRRGRLAPPTRCEVPR